MGGGRSAPSPRGGLLDNAIEKNTHFLSSRSGLLRLVTLRSMRSRLTTLAIFFVFFCVFLLNSTHRPGTSERYAGLPSDTGSCLSEAFLPDAAKGSSHGQTICSERPSFHLLIRRSHRSPDRNAGLCRTIFTGMILNYPPPTLIDGGSPNGTIEAIYNYLSNTSKVKDNDVVLIVDEADIWFQLPPDVLLRRFYGLLVQDNKKLRRKYGQRTKANGGTTQMFSERIIFGADKVCHARYHQYPACAAVPYPTLMPDIYGTNTDVANHTAEFRPRWLNSGAVMGILADVRLMYQTAAGRAHQNRHEAYDEQEVMSRIFGEQEYVREQYRLAYARNWVTRLGEAVGVLDTVPVSHIPVGIFEGKRYEYGIGLDYKSDLFFTTSNSGNDIGWLKFDEPSTLSRVQANHHVPRESRLILPRDIAQLPSLVGLPPNKTESLPASPKPSPAFNASLDKLPRPINHSWDNVPLLTNVRTAAIPALIHLNNTDRDTADHWWSLTWYHPWARALLRHYMRSTQHPEVVSASMQGGEDRWDARGGNGGVWTQDNEWKSWTEVCKGFEGAVFGDGLGEWGKEGGIDRDPPVYNRWGVLLRGTPKE